MPVRTYLVVAVIKTEVEHYSKFFIFNNQVKDTPLPPLRKEKMQPAHDAANKLGACTTAGQSATFSYILSLLDKCGKVPVNGEKAGTAESAGTMSRRGGGWKGGGGESTRGKERRKLEFDRARSIYLLYFLGCK